MRYVVTPFVDETYPNEVAFLAIHLGDGYHSGFGNARRVAYYPGTMYIPDAIFDAGVDHFVGYPGNPPTNWINKVDSRLSVTTDVTIDIIPTFITPEQWTFTANVCMEPTGTQRMMGVNIAFTVDDYPDTYPYRYRKTLRNGYGPEVIDLSPGECQQVETTFNFGYVELERWPGVEVVAWAQTPSSGWGEAYQAATLSMTVHADDFESGNLDGGWTLVVP
jgi:hypothetical protein